MGGGAWRKPEFRGLLRAGEFSEVAARAVRVEQKTRHSMIFSFEKMALRDAVKTVEGARTFAEGLYEFLHGARHGRAQIRGLGRFGGALPRRQTRVLTWPMVTVLGFIAQPETHIFLKPTVTRVAAEKYGFDFRYKSRPSWETYSNYLDFAETSPPRPEGSRPARHDRHTVLPVGAGLGRVPGLAHAGLV